MSPEDSTPDEGQVSEEGEGNLKLSDVLGRAGKKKARKRVGRGQGSGNGKTAGRGQNGAKSRSGWKQRLAYEGGQMPLMRRLPKRGFTNAPFKRRFDVVNLRFLEKCFESGDTVDLAVLEERGVLKSRHGRLKILGTGELSKKLTVVADGISEGARQKIEAAGGEIRPTPASEKAAARAGKKGRDRKQK